MGVCFAECYRNFEKSCDFINKGTICETLLLKYFTVNSIHED